MDATHIILREYTFKKKCSSQNLACTLFTNIIAITIILLCLWEKYIYYIEDIHE